MAEIFTDDHVMQRFFTKVLIPNNNGCMNWLGTKNHKGYGAFWDGSSYANGHKRMVSAHRFS